MRWPIVVMFFAGSFAVAAIASAQQADVLSLDFAAAQQRLVATSDAIEAAAANVRSKEAQDGATRSLRRPDVDLEAQLLEYQKTLYLPLGSLAPLAEPFGIQDPLRFQQRRTAIRPILTTTLPIYSGGQIPATQAGTKAQVMRARAWLATLARLLPTTPGINLLVGVNQMGASAAEQAMELCNLAIRTVLDGWIAARRLVAR